MPLTPTGLEISNLDTILSRIVEDEKSEINQNIDTRPDELLGQLNNIFAVVIAEEEELAQAVNDNFNPLKAEGKNLDDIGSITGVARNNSTPSVTTAQVFYSATSGTIVAINTVLVSSTNVLFKTDKAITIQGTDTYATKLDVNAIPFGTVYTFDVNGSAINHTSTGVLATDIAALVVKVDTAGTTEFKSEATDDGINILALDSRVTVTSLTNVEIKGYGKEVESSAMADGNVLSDIGTVIRIRTAITGLSTYNDTPYLHGTDVESDEDYRVRILNDQGASSASTEPALTRAIGNLAGVASVTIVQNRTFVVVDGRPPKSFESIVEGGNSQDVAQMIWDTQPAGIETYGTEPVYTVKDSNGADQEVYFSRPVASFLAVRVTYAEYDEEVQTFDVENVMRPIVSSHVVDLGNGTDVFTSRLFGPLYQALSGYNITGIEIQTLANLGDTPDSGSWSSATIAMTANQYGYMLDSDVYFVAV